MSDEAEVECAACGGPGECGVWGTKLCYPCASDWRDRAPTYGDIIAKYGSDDNSVAVYRAFTERWLQKRRAA